MRRLVISLVLIVGFSFQAGQIFAASFETYSKVNIVPVANALWTKSYDPSGGQLSLSGSAMSHVSCQISAPGLDSSVLKSQYDTQEILNLGFPAAPTDNNTPPTSERIITVVFE